MHVSATDTYHVLPQLPTQLAFMGSNPGSPHHVGILTSFLLPLVSWSAFLLVFSPGVCHKWTGSHFRSGESIQIPTSVLLPTTLKYALLQPTPSSSLFNSDLLSQLHCAIWSGIDINAFHQVSFLLQSQRGVLMVVSSSKSCRYNYRSAHRLTLANSILK